MPQLQEEELSAIINYKDLNSSHLGLECLVVPNDLHVESKIPEKYQILTEVRHTICDFYEPDNNSVFNMEPTKSLGPMFELMGRTCFAFKIPIKVYLHSKYPVLQRVVTQSIEMAKILNLPEPIHMYSNVRLDSQVKVFFK